MSLFSVICSSKIVKIWDEIPDSLKKKRLPEEISSDSLSFYVFSYITDIIQAGFLS